MVQQSKEKLQALFVGEAVTMAHVLRPWALAKALDSERYQVHFAVDPRHITTLLGTIPPRIGMHPIHTIEPKVFASRLAEGAPVYRQDELETYLKDDLRLLDEVQPDIVVGDFRVTLSIAAQLRRIPLVALMHAHWSPSSLAPIPTPDLPAERLLGANLLGHVIQLLAPTLFRLHGRAFNRLRAQHGLAPMNGIRQMYTEATRTLYLDLPALAPTRPLPPHQMFAGPLPVEPDVPLPSWSDELPKNRPIVYVSPGSSGNPKTMQQAIASLSQQATVIVATAGRMEVPTAPGRVFSAKFLPGSWACQRADMVICNGGTGAVYQALREGKPILALPSNMDQWFVTEALTRKGAALSLRTRQAQPNSIRQAVLRLLREPTFRQEAQNLGHRMSAFDPYRTLQEQIDTLVPVRRVKQSKIHNAVNQRRGLLSGRKSIALQTAVGTG